MTKLWIDTETFSTVPIKHGAHKYAEAVEVMLFAWAVDDGPVHVWDMTAGPMPTDLTKALEYATEIWAHNSGFDRTVLRHYWARTGAISQTDPHQPDSSLHRWRDTMVQAYAHSLPGALGDLCTVLGMPADKAKDKEGKALVRLFCMPNLKGERNTRETHPEQWAKFIAYAGQDIVAMREAHKRMPKWNYPDNASEVALWHLDQRINDRGLCIDTALAQAAVRAVEKAQKKLARRTVDLTEGQVQTATQRDAMLAHILEAYGVDLPDLQASTLERRINDASLPLPLRELLAVRLQASTTSTAKYNTLIRSTSSDGRLRGTLQFCGAGRTGRWAGRLFQPQNLPRPVLDQDDIEQGIDALKADAADLVYANVMELTSSALRGAIVAPPGKKLVVADLSNIEGRDQAWLAGETWKIKAFEAFDTVLTKSGHWLTGPELKAAYLRHEYPDLELDAKGDPVRKGPDLYKMAYGKSFGMDPKDVTKDQRQVGKVQELALGYEGGVGAFVTFATAYAIDLEELPAKVFEVADPELVRGARDFLEWTTKQKRKNATMGLSDDAFVACDTLKRAWRRAHIRISSTWPALKAAVIEAIDSPGKTISTGVLKIRRDGAWLRIVLPSGKALCYPNPRVDEGVISYMGMDQYTRKWSRLESYGGKFFENVCQRVAREVMGDNMPAIDAYGYEIVTSVHDELPTEAPDTPEFNHRHLSALLATNPAWAPDMPLAAAGFESYRYKKD